MNDSLSGPPTGTVDQNDLVRSYIFKETIFSTIANSLISLGFALAVAHGMEEVPVWRGIGVAVDFVPQTFMLVCMTTLVVTAIARMNMRKNRVPFIRAPASAFINMAPASLTVRSLVFGLFAVLALVPLLVTVLFLLGVDSLGYGIFIGVKVIYGAILSILIAPFILRVALTLDFAPKL